MIITGGFGKAFRYEVKEGETVIGREDDAGLVLPNNSVSRRHARLSWDGEVLQITDLDSRNGLKVNGEKVEGAALGPGDFAQIGKFRFTRVALDETLFEGRFIQYMDEYTPAATASRSATISMELGAGNVLLDHIRESACIVVQDDPERFWIPGEHPLTFGGDALIEVGGLFAGGVAAEITLGEKGHTLAKKKGLVTVKHQGKGTKAALLQPNETFQVGNTVFVYKVPGL